jgi:ketosteroid isomerase-like protein
VSADNVEVVRRVYEAVARRDTAAVLALYDPDVEWDASRGTPLGELTGGSDVYRGHEGLRRWFREWYEAWESLEDRCDELIDAHDQVVSVSTIRAKGRASGLVVEFSARFAVWTIRHGRVARVVWFPSRQEALQAAGLNP